KKMRTSNQENPVQVIEEVKAVQLLYQAVIQSDRILSIVHLLLRLKRRNCAFFTTLSVWVDHFRLSVMCMPRNLKLFTFSTVVPSMWTGGCSLCCFLKSAPGRDGQSAPGRDGQSAPGRDGQSAPGRDGQSAPGRDGQSAPGRAGQSAPGRDGQSAPGRDGQSAPGRDGQSAPGRAGQSAPGRAGQSAPGRDGQSAPGRDGQSALGRAGQLVFSVCTY
uniref:Uncharacterized protein n=1 Tax=Salmo trutta TaxID=8032 RepID=A0A674END0_SALTR